MISPVKAALGAEYGEMDARLMAAVHRRFGLPATLPLPVKRQIKLADRVSARLEAVQIAGFSAAEATRLFPLPDTRMIEGLQIRLRPPAETRADYLARHHELIGLIDGRAPADGGPARPAA